MTPRDKRRLTDCHPSLVGKVALLLHRMEALGHPMFVTEGVRTAERQAALYAQGRTTPGPIVTKCDGVRRRSNHQVKKDGYGYAVDLAFRGPTPFDGPWELFGKEARALGLKWGGDFPSFDGPHVELPR